MGAEALTTNVTFAVLEPAEFVAVTVYKVEARVAFGVPEMTQVELLIVAHAGRAGEAVHDVIAAPLFSNVDGVTVINEGPTLPLVPVLPE